MKYRLTKIIRAPVVTIALAVLLLSASGFCTDLFLLSTRPYPGSSGLRPPYVAVLYNLTDDLSLGEVWSDTAQTYFMDAGYIADSKEFFLSYGEGFIKKMIIFKAESPSSPNIIDLRFDDPVTAVRFYINAAGESSLEVKLFKSSRKTQGSRVNRRYSKVLSTADGKVKANASIAKLGEMRLRGLGKKWGFNEHDIISLRMTKDGLLAPSSNQFFKVDWPIVPDSLLIMKSSYRWNQIANESDFQVISSVPEKAGYESRELLIFDRIKSQWHSIMIPGNRTAPRLQNGWLIARIADPNPRNDFERGVGYGSIYRTEWVIVNPYTYSMFTVSLGEKGDILWIEGDIVYYKVGQFLFQARIENNNFVDRTMLLEDPRLRSINWSFTGSVENLIIKKDVPKSRVTKIKIINDCSDVY